MNLARVRLQLTILFGLMAALAVGAITWYAIAQGSDRIYEAAERDAESVLKDLAIDRLNGEDIDENNTWQVTINDDWENAEPFGNVWVEPPLYSIVARGGGARHFERFEQDGPWLAHSESVNENNWVVTAIELDEYEADVRSLRWRLLLAAAGSVLLMGATGYWLAGRSLRPARLAMAQQRDFIADAAHELRTPLAVIQASASHTLSRPRSDTEYREALSEVLTATNRAGSSVGELLELARLDAGQAQPRLAPLRCDLLVEEVAAGIRVDDTTLVAEVHEAIVIDADYGLLRQVVETLARNSAARAANVTIASRVDGDRAVIEIIDDGPGFDPAVLPHVFDRFRRGDSMGSSGLGMAIAKKIVEAHEGTIAAANRTDTPGAVVTIRLPKGDTEAGY